MMVFVSSRISRSLTRVETFEAFHKYVSIRSAEILDKKYEPGNPIVIFKSGFLAFLLRTDPTISSISFEGLWPYLCEKVTQYCNGNFQYVYDKPGLQVRERDIENSLRSISQFVTLGIPLEDDKLDETLNKSEPQDSVAPTGILKQMIDRDNAILKRLDSINDATLALAQNIAEANQFQIRPIRDTLGNLVVSINPQQFEKLMMSATVAELTTTEEEPRRLTMSEKITKAAVETGTGVVSAMQEGLKISVSQQSAKKIVQLFHSKLGHHIPGASTPLGQKAEEIMIPAFVHFTASALSDKIPKAEFVQRACLRAITGTSKDSGDELLEMLLPLFNEIISMETMNEVAQQFAGEPAIGSQEPAQLEGIETKALSTMLAQQLRDIPAGEEFEIVIRRPESPSRSKATGSGIPEVDREEQCSSTTQ